MKKLFLFLILISHIACGQKGTKTASFTNRGATIQYKIYGEGKPLIFINGGPGFSSLGAEGFAKAFSKKGYQVIIFDQRGTGKSTISVYDSTTITVDLLCSDINELIRVTGNKTVSIMGHSFGGILAMNFAVKYPNRIDKLILSSSAGINLDFLNYFADNIKQRLGNVVKDKVTKTPVTLKEREEAFFRQLKINAPAYFYDKTKVDEFVKRLTVPGSYNPDYNTLMWTDLFRINYDLRGKFDKFKQPTLVVQGRQDILGDETAIRIHESIKQSKLVFIDRCGHVPFMDKPQEFYSILKEFLEEK